MKRTLALPLVLLVACGPTPESPGDGGEPDDDAGTVNDDAGATDVLTAPATLAVSEGRTATFTYDASGPVTLTASAGLTVVDDAGAVTVRATLGTLAGEVSLALGDLTATVVVEVTPLAFTTVSWDGADGPVAREHGALFVSDDGASVFLFGGGGYPNYPNQELFDDAWRFDVATSTWSPWTVSGDVPPPLASRRAARASGDVAFLHGGYSDGFASDDGLFRVDLATGLFTELAQITPPPARSLHAFAYDEAHRRFVVYGGFFDDGNTQALLSDTWIGTYNDDTASVRWSEVDGAGPPARYGMFFGFDDTTAKLVVHSGAGFPAAGDPINAHDDVWVLSLADAPAWTALEPLGAVPTGRRNGCGVVDPATHALLVTGGTADGATTEPGVSLLTLDDTPTWIALDRPGAPPVRSSGFGAALPGGGFVCGFGNDAALYRDLTFLR